MHLRSTGRRRGLALGAAIALFATVAPIATAVNVASGRTTARTAAAKPHIDVGTKNFGEEYLVSDMYRLLLEKNGFNVGKTHDLTSTGILQTALLRGQIDLYPEYTGTGLTVVLNKPAISNAGRAYRVVKAAYQKRFRLTWLQQAPMNDTNGIAVTQATARKYGLRTLNDLRGAAPQLSFAGLPECKDRADCLGGLQNKYGIRFKSIASVGSQPILYKGIRDGTYDVIEVFTTDGPIQALNLRVLTDPRGIFPADHIAPVVRDSTLRKYPRIRSILNRLAPYLTTAALKKMNVQVVLNTKDPLVVARQFLKSKNLL